MQLQNPVVQHSSPRLALVWIDFGAYHLARLRAIQEVLGGECVGIELVGGYGTSDCCDLPFRSQERAGLNIITLFPNQNLPDLSTWQLSIKLIQALDQLSPESIALCGYHRIENLIALAWARFRGCTVVLMSESKQDDAPRQPLQEWIKSLLVRCFHGYLVGGQPQRQYILEMGAHQERVFEGYDAVDNLLFQEGAAQARSTQTALRSALGLPEHYFIAVCRFVPKKNLSFLLEAYRQYRNSNKNGWDLVLCGGGPLEQALRSQIAESEIPGVHFTGFLKGADLAQYYGLASCFVHPSIQEQWGLVVNEAMASGLPVLVSSNCGCAQDLVQEGINGFTFDPQNVDELASCMGQITDRKASLASMGTASQQIIEHFSPQVFAENLLRAAKLAEQNNRPSSNERYTDIFW
jgi:1,2-diacylglycerol 3-alpha-glucosyltransferase